MEKLVFFRNFISGLAKNMFKIIGGHMIKVFINISSNQMAMIQDLKPFENHCSGLLITLTHSEDVGVHFRKLPEEK